MFAKRVFQAAGAWGLLVMVLGYGSFLAGADPTLLNPVRPEFIHGFFLLCFPWQLLFLLISTDPERYNQVMPLAVLEKLPFSAVTMSLFVRGEVGSLMAFFGAVDALFGVLFCAAYWLTRTSGRGAD